MGRLAEQPENTSEQARPVNLIHRMLDVGDGENLELGMRGVLEIARRHHQAILAAFYVSIDFRYIG